MTKRVFPSGRTSTLAYDAAGRPLSIEHGDGGFARYAYDARGDITGADTESAEVRYERDALGRIVRESQDGGEHWVEARHDAAGARVEVKTWLGARQRIERDALQDVAALHHGASFELGFERDALGAERSRSLPGGLRLDWERDLAGRPKMRRTTRRAPGAQGPETSGREVDVLVYQWRGEDQIAAIIDANRGPRFFDHDGRGRLIRERRPDGALERAMDVVGNIFRGADQRDRSYGPGGVLLEADASDGSGTVRYAHDKDGNQIE